LRSCFTTVFLPADLGLGSAPAEGLALGRLRLRGVHRQGPFILEAAYELAPRVEDRGILGTGLLPRPSAADYRLVDFGQRLYPGPGEQLGSFALRHNLDRLELGFSLGPADISLGRQALAFGSARVVNPVDVVAPFTFEEIDKEERFGVDAVRLRIAAGALSEVDVGAVLGEGLAFDKSAVYGRGRFYWSETDIGPLAAVFRENVLLGLDLVRSFGGAGWWFEAAHTWAGAAGEYLADENYWGLSSGLDYSLGSFYGLVEYHFNSAGAAAERQYLLNAFQTAYRAGGVYLLGRHYLAPGLNYPLTPLLNVGVQGLVNWVFSQFDVSCSKRIPIV